MTGGRSDPCPLHARPVRAHPRTIIGGAAVTILEAVICGSRKGWRARLNNREIAERMLCGRLARRADQDAKWDIRFSARISAGPAGARIRVHVSHCTKRFFHGHYRAEPRRAGEAGRRRLGAGHREAAPCRTGRSRRLRTGCPFSTRRKLDSAHADVGRCASRTHYGDLLLRGRALDYGLIRDVAAVPARVPAEHDACDDLRTRRIRSRRESRGEAPRFVRHGAGPSRTRQPGSRWGSRASIRTSRTLRSPRGTASTERGGRPRRSSRVWWSACSSRWDSRTPR